MKRFFLVIIVLGVLAWVGAYVFYRYYFPDMMARAIVSNETPQYIPRRLMNKVDELRAPVNKGADEIVREMKKNNIALEDVVQVIDKTTEEDAREFLVDLNTSKPKTPNEVFDIAKKTHPC